MQQSLYTSLVAPERRQKQWRKWLGDVVGLELDKIAGSTPAQVGGFSGCKKSTGSMWYNYTACKRSLECLFGLDALG
ncbi:hypothetical protein TNCV_4957411 [Trichonephila clavipes]|nr:hypothetical protein TNCV_4957411 [Trichonephila clavipes]